ncbi:polysaccharide deacetylase family protein [Nocardiopsis sp. NRRL B-16309]|uniref:polysaccharide deacetylase family protein n=1 Tax=Nocardiopsis sp. NRRL B-16309 TaxID=1519494 RepID=UPI0006AF00F6|nr:polysaccharide deacetylase family protein [Nocardiopsis sp. NRRL B-16309]KOX18098.1 polysaccharide deacetylase [Nocardiopsis sp. NRRL B-16309]
MAPDRPLVTVVIAMVVLLGLVLLATRPSGPMAHLDSETTSDESGEDASAREVPATGDPDELTVVDPDHVVGLDEAELAYDGDLDVAVRYPVLPNAQPLTDFLDRTLAASVDAFDAANPGAESYEAEWELTAANDDLVGVRVTSLETDSEGTRECHTTYWYDTASGQTFESTRLFGGQEELAEVNGLVKEGVPDTAYTDTIHPVAALYDSVGFNPDGDLVVEFDAGQVAAPDEGRVHAVVDREETGPLLSDLGARVRDASTVGVREFAIAGPPEAAKDGQDDPKPGHLSPVDEEVDCSDPGTKCVALTYDDGPGGGTPALLDTLAEYDARATFFVTGGPVMADPLTVRRAYAEGHEIANHTLGHPDLTGLSESGVRAELATVQAQIYRETGYTPDLMRPPYGATDETVASVTADMGLAQILWNIDTNDWKDRDAAVVKGRALNGASDGAIILMHDIHPTSVAASRGIIRELDARGYTMVTVSQLLGATEPGETYVDGVPAPPEDGPSPDGDDGHHGDE